MRSWPPQKRARECVMNLSLILLASISRAGPKKVGLSQRRDRNFLSAMPFHSLFLTSLIALRQLVLLNTLIYNQDGITAGIAKQRLIFFVKHVTPWLQDLESPLSVRAELARALTSLLPLISDIYGEHWGEILNALTSSWKKTTEIQENESGGYR